MPTRLFVTVLAALIVALGAPGNHPSAAALDVQDHAGIVAQVTDTDDPTSTINPFLPEERGLGECISAVQKPGCGSDARGGWQQAIVFAAIIAGLAFIAWRIVRASRRARAGRPGPSAPDDDPTTAPPSPGSTTAPADRGGDPAP